MFMLSWIFVIVCGNFECVFYFYFLFIYVLLLEIQLSRGEGWDPINRFNPATSLCLSQARTWISNIMLLSLIFVFNELRWEVIVCFVDIGGIVDHHCLNFLFIIALV